MSLEFRIAKTEEERKKCFRVRYEVYAEVGYINPKDYQNKLLIDEYDKYSTIFMGVKDEEVVGTLRATEDSELGFQMEKIFKEEVVKLRKNCKKIIETSRIMALSTQRYKIALGLINLAYLFAKQQEITDYCFTTPPTIAKTWEKIGMFPFGEIKFYPLVNQPAVPIHWKVENTLEPYKTLFEKAENVSL